MQRVALSHPFGNPNSYNAALAFYERNLLSCFHTCLFAPLGMERRFHPGLRRAPVVTHPQREIARLVSTMVPFSRWNGRSAQMVDRTGAAFDARVSDQLSPSDGAIYAYEDWAFRSFRRARELGLPTFYELPTAHFAEKASWLTLELDREPELARFFDALNEPQDKLLRKQAELEAAAVIVCPSSLVKTSIQDKLPTSTPIHVVPYGTDVSVPSKQWQSSDLYHPIRCVYAGPLNPQKGIHRLFEALERLPFHSYVLTLAGRWTPGFREWLERRYRVHYEHVGHVGAPELYDLYRRSHVLVLPSLCDGFGLVLLEAMASGIPVIASHRTAAPDIISHGAEGYLVRAGDTEDLVRALERCLHDPVALAEMGTGARIKAAQFTWRVYRERLICALYGPLQNGTGNATAS
ncbi:MAG: glycosyl transferase group 1 [Bryobacterales bacterium]|nr:glycosyl transferase group 1 [Bryobacterales bacterium]